MRRFASATSRPCSRRSARLIRYQRGERPSLKEYLDRYPDLADDLRELFPAMVEIEQVKEDQQQAEAARSTPPPPRSSLDRSNPRRRVNR